MGTAAFLQEIFLPAVDHALGRQGLPGAKLVGFNDDEVITCSRKRIADPQAGNTAPQDNNVIIARHAINGDTPKPVVTKLMPPIFT